MSQGMKAATLRREGPIQISLLGLDPVEAAVKQLAEAGTEERGPIFTK